MGYGGCTQNPSLGTLPSPVHKSEAYTRTPDSTLSGESNDNVKVNWHSLPYMITDRVNKAQFERSAWAKSKDTLELLILHHDGDHVLT
jgi:hypothetical protein